jgi:uncharacterized protein with HEPN domain
MDDRVIFRLQDIKDNIGNIRSLLDGKSFEQMYSDVVIRAAFERFLEIVSEASRHVPEDLRTTSGLTIPWRQVADIGNILRHTYFRTDAELLWNVYVSELDPLEDVIDKMLAALAATPPPPATS